MLTSFLCFHWYFCDNRNVFEADRPPDHHPNLWLPSQIGYQILDRSLVRLLQNVNFTTNNKKRVLVIRLLNINPPGVMAIWAQLYLFMFKFYYFLFLFVVIDILQIVYGFNFCNLTYL